MNSAPNITLFGFSLTLSNEDSSERPIHSLVVKFIQDSDVLCEWKLEKTSHGRWESPNRITLPVAAMIEIDIAAENGGNDSVPPRLGAISVGLEDYSPHDAPMAVYNKAVTETLQLAFSSAAFPTSPVVDSPHFLLFELCSSETSNSEFVQSLIQLEDLSSQPDVFIIIRRHQLDRIRTRCLSLTISDGRTSALVCFAEVLHRQSISLQERDTQDQIYELLVGDIVDAMQTLVEEMYANGTPGTDSSDSVATSIGREVERIQAGPHNDLFRNAQFAHFYGIGTMQLDQYDEFKNISDLDAAIAAMNDALAFPCPSPKWITLINIDMCRGLLSRFIELGHRNDLDRAIECTVEVLDAEPTASPLRAAIDAMQILAEEAYTNATPRTESSSLVDMAREVEHILNDPRRYVFKDEPSYEVASHNLEVYNDSKNISDLDTTIADMNDVLALPNLPPEWITFINVALVHKYLRRFIRLRDQNDLDRAIECARVLDAEPTDSPLRVGCLSSQASLLTLKYAAAKPDDADPRDMEKSIEIYEELAKTMSDGDVDARPSMVEIKTRLARRLIERSMPLGDKIPFTLETMDAILEAAAVAAPGNASKQMEADMERGFQMLNDLLHTTQHSDPDVLIGMSDALVLRFLNYRDRHDLHEALGLLKKTASVDSFLFRLKLTSVHFLQYYYYPGEDASLVHLRQAILHSSYVATSPEFPPNHRMTMACAWGRCAFKLPNTTERATVCVTAQTTVMDVLPSKAWVGMSMRDRRNDLWNEISPQVEGLDLDVETKLPSDTVGQAACDAAATVLIFDRGDGTEAARLAVEWIEQGQSIIWDQLLGFRAPLDELRTVNEGLAERLGKVAEELTKSGVKDRFVSAAVRGQEGEGERHRRLVEEWEKGIEQARELPGLKDFLRPKPFEYLSRAAEDAILVVLNVSCYGCDALVLLSPRKSVYRVPLPELSIRDVAKMHKKLLSVTKDDLAFRRLPADEVARTPIHLAWDDDGWKNMDPEGTFKQILGDLWYKIVRPVLRVIDTREDYVLRKPRPLVRWCATGQLAFLPLHAAGDYEKSEPGHRVFDFVVSSYIPNMKSVIRSPILDPKPDTKRKILAVACTSVKGQVPLFGANQEVTRVKKQAKAATSCEVLELLDGQATADRVLEEMKSAAWVHLACHGVQDAKNPHNSALLLANGTRLTLSDLATSKLPQAELAFLSACQTATGYDRLPSESFHLAAGMLLAGYRSVIATMWSIEDRHAPQVADDVYGYLLGREERFDCGVSALALDGAIKRLRETVGEKSFLKWVPYIHVGA